MSENEKADSPPDFRYRPCGNSVGAAIGGFYAAPVLAFDGNLLGILFLRLFSLLSTTMAASNDDDLPISASTLRSKNESSEIVLFASGSVQRKLMRRPPTDRA